MKMNIIEGAEKILQRKQLPIFAWENPEDHDILVTGIYFTEDNFRIEYVGK
jgi:hypothetical protein